MWLGVTVVVDCVYVGLYFGMWNVDLQLDVPVIGEVFREVCVVVGVVNVGVKIAMAFCLWKMALGMKLNYINRDVKLNEMLLKNGGGDYESAGNEFMMKDFRLRVNVGSGEEGYSIRDFGNGFLI
jgi:hypothetical protein